MDDEPPLRTTSKLPQFHIENLLSSGGSPCARRSLSPSSDGSISPGTDNNPHDMLCRPPAFLADLSDRVQPHHPPPSAFTPLYSAQVQLAKSKAPSLHQLQLDWLARTGMLYSAPRLHLPPEMKLDQYTCGSGPGLQVGPVL
ncbi:unnamed protein product [Nesidiocoris tenuis]|uniref:Uncharacterized protein n=1 Tax=Nesidiocoris tenuis TaxID=355587 RepID=A0A6H5HJR7_9HEMI|nr:unnamed protein product [Nesidiocoris tenuis]